MRIQLRVAAAYAAAVLIVLPGVAAGQDTEADLGALLERARSASPLIAAAERAVAAARARAEAAGALPDPRLALGLTNALVSDPLSSDDMMTMRMVQLGTTIPYPGKLALDREAARWRLAVAEAEREATLREVVADVRKAYYELAFLDRAIDVVRENRSLLGDLAEVTAARYRVGTGPQQDVLKADVETTRLGDELLGLARERETILARLNALLDRPVETPLPAPKLPAAILAAAVPAAGESVTFTAAALDPAGGSAGPIPSRAALLEFARAGDPRLAAIASRVEAERAEAELAGKAALPDFDVLVGYGQRSGREDMVSVMASVPLPLFKGRKQDPLAEAARAETRATENLLAAMSDEVEAEVVGLHASLVRTRDRLALLRDGILPQARTSLESAIAGYPVGRIDFLTLINNQVTLYRHELDWWRFLTRFASDLADLERVTGHEVLR
jgi:outer membrane protein TolC